MFSIQETKRNGHPTLQLSEELTIYVASEARALLAVFDLLKVTALFGDPILITPTNH